MDFHPSPGFHPIECHSGDSIFTTMDEARLVPTQSSISMKNARIYLATLLISFTSYLGLAEDILRAQDQDIVAVAAASPKFTTLVAAIKAAGLVETLKGTGPFTVFAPTDKAFEKLPSGVLENLLKPENKEKLTALLNHHVVLGKILAADVKTGPVKSVGGPSLEIRVLDGKVTVSGAKVVKADIIASNGVIHAIDAVILE